MGSPSSRLKTPEKLRPWLESGLEYVFNPAGAQQVAQGVQQQAQPQQNAPASQQAPQQYQQQAPAQQQAPVQQSAPVQQQQVAQQPVQQMASPARPPISDAASKFPEPWSTFLARVPEAPKVVWTYMELGLDLGGQADPKRGAVLRNLLANHLKWPKGTTAFWPVAALLNSALQPNSAMFWKGWELWKTPYIACFGEEALRIIHPDAEPGNTTYLLDHVTIFVLPPISKLTTMLPHEQQMSVDLLSGVRL
ncbi:MAG: hypothetical protein OCC46_13225 [Pseudodesulfovibrio sp.]